MVKAKPNETIDSLIRRFKKDVEKAGIIKELKRREYYLSPSLKKRLKHQAALKEAQKRASNRKVIYD